MAEAENSIAADNLFFLASAFSRMLSKEADEVFASVGLSSSHALIVMIVQKEPGIQPSSLAEKLHLSPSTITRLVEKLERRKLVKRESEGRATSIVCTSEGIEMAAEIEKEWQGLLEQKKNELGERYISVLSEMIANALNAFS